MKYIVGMVAALGLFMTSPAFAAGLEELYVYPSVQYFTWEELRDDGSRILKESGPLFGAGAAVKVDLYNKSLMLKGKGELFGGQVDYDGQTQTDPNPALSELPVKSDVTYIGTKEELDLGWRFNVRRVSVEPFAGLGHRWWIRDIHDSTAADKTPQRNPVRVSGATETWQTIYTRFGARADYLISDDWKLFGEAGAKYPVYNRNTADLQGGGDVTIKPGREVSAFAEASLKYRQFRTSLFYEGFRFSKSPVVPIGGNTVVFQPKSESDIFGISLGWAFR